MANTDSETGEYVCQSYQSQPQMSERREYPDYDMETGEPGHNTVIVTKNKPKFSIPKRLIQAPEEKKCCIDPNDNFTLCRKEEVISLQEVKSRIIQSDYLPMSSLMLFFSSAQEIIFGCNQTSHRLFLILIPSLAIFTRISAILTVLIEICLHLWAHKKNQRNTNETIYYRSPLHVITSQFCAVCRQEREMEQVSKLQDRRKRIWRFHLEDVARRIT